MHRIAAAIDRAKPDLEQFVARHLECPEAVPLIFVARLATIREIRSLKITPRYHADFPEVDVAVAMQVSMICENTTGLRWSGDTAVLARRGDGCRRHGDEARIRPRAAARAAGRLVGWLM